MGNPDRKVVAPFSVESHELVRVSVAQEMIDMLGTLVGLLLVGAFVVYVLPVLLIFVLVALGHAYISG